MATYTVGSWENIATHVADIRILQIRSLTIIYPGDTVTLHLPEADSTYNVTEVLEQGRGPQPKVVGFRLSAKVYVTPNNFREMMPMMAVMATKTPYKVRLWLDTRDGQPGGGGMFIGGGTIGAPGGTGFETPDPDPSDDYIIKCGATFGVDGAADRPRLWVAIEQIYSLGAMLTAWDPDNPTGSMFYQLDGWGD